MGAIDVAAKVRATAMAEIERQCFGEDFGVDVAVATGRGPGGGMMVAYTLIISTRPPLLGASPLFRVMQVPSADPPAEMIENAVAEGLRKLREQVVGTLRPKAKTAAISPN